MSLRRTLSAGSYLWVVTLAAATVVLSGLVMVTATGHPTLRLAASQSSLPPSLQAEIKANDAAGLPGLDRGVTVPTGCDIRTSMDQNNGRPRIEQERTQHRMLNVGQTPAYIQVANAQLQAYLQVSVQDYCANHG